MTDQLSGQKVYEAWAAAWYDRTGAPWKSLSQQVRTAWDATAAALISAPSRLMENKKHRIEIGSNAHVDKLGHSAQLSAINALMGVNRSIVVEFETDHFGRLVNAKARIAAPGESP